MSDSQITLWGAGTSRTIRPIWIAEELGLRYKLKRIGPRTGETQTESYTLLNPKQKIPFLEDGSLQLSESVVMEQQPQLPRQLLLKSRRRKMNGLVSFTVNWTRRVFIS